MSQSSSEIILVLAPTVNDGAVAVQVIESSGLQAVACSRVEQVCELFLSGCGAIIISEEALNRESVASLESFLDQQEAWSDVPIILLTGADIVKAAELFSKTGNISLLERPFSRLTLIRSVEVALRARRKQYQVRKLLEDLLRLKDDADRANVTKTQFLANMSHEIRTPIGAIMGFSDLMKNPTNLPEENLKYMGIIERNSHQLLRLIDDILDLSKVEAGKMTIETINFNLPELIADFNSVMSFKAIEKGISFRTKFETLIPELTSSDPGRLRQILSNIVGNALKFTNQGEVELKVSYQAPILKFVVEDTGVGLTPQQAVNLFKPFAQADTSTTRKFGGTGLGLVLSRHLAEAMGGSLKLVQTSEGEGSVFVVEIKTTPVSNAPLVGKESLVFESSSLDLKKSEQVLLGLKVLLAEDSPDNQMLITTYLRKTGAKLKMVSNGLEAIEVALKERFDVILMDIQMPLMDGHEAARSLRKARYDRPIVALTAHAMKEERLKSFESGFTEFLTKPIQPERLIAVLSRYKEL